MITYFDSILKKIVYFKKEEAEETFSQLIKLAKSDGVFDDAEKCIILDLINNYKSHNFKGLLTKEIKKELNVKVVKHPAYLLLYMIILAYIDGHICQAEWNTIEKTAKLIKVGDKKLNKLHTIVKRKVFNTMVYHIYSTKIDKKTRIFFLLDITKYLNLSEEIAAKEEESVRNKIGGRAHLIC